jgi:hypothetical protein
MAVLTYRAGKDNLCSLPEKKKQFIRTEQKTNVANIDLNITLFTWLVRVFLRKCNQPLMHSGKFCVLSGLKLKNSTFCPHTVFMCFVWISEQTAIISLYSIN